LKIVGAIQESDHMLLANESKPLVVVTTLDRAEKKALEDPLSAVQCKQCRAIWGFLLRPLLIYHNCNLFLRKSLDYSNDIFDPNIAHETSERYQQNSGHIIKDPLFFLPTLFEFSGFFSKDLILEPGAFVILIRGEEHFAFIFIPMTMTHPYHRPVRKL